jgi:hypothetical protein
MGRSWWLILKNGPPTPSPWSTGSIVTDIGFILIQFFTSHNGIAIHASVKRLCAVNDLEDLRKLLLDGDDASRVLALKNIGKCFRKLKSLFVYPYSVLNVVYGYTRIYIAKYIKIDIQVF